MNCFEARNDFVAFWQKTLDGNRRVQLLAHLRGCAGCDRSFRSFALTAPVLYSAFEPGPNSEIAQPAPGQSVGFEPPRGAPVREHRSRLSRWNRLSPALIVAAAAVIALYFAVPSRMTFEDAIAAENESTEIASYPLTDSLFGQELIAQGGRPAEMADE